jgi:hypothetical protein
MARRKENELSHTTLMNTREAMRLPSTNDIPVVAGSSNLNPSKAEEIKQAPIMVAVPSDDGFHTARGGETLDAFGPMTHRA